MLGQALQGIHQLLIVLRVEWKPGHQNRANSLTRVSSDCDSYPMDANFMLRDLDKPVWHLETRQQAIGASEKTAPEIIRNSPLALLVHVWRHIVEIVFVFRTGNHVNAIYGGCYRESIIVSQQTLVM